MVITFIRDNLVFFLAIGSALITFMIFLVEKLVKKQKLKLVLIFTALGLLAFIGKEFIKLQESKNKALLEKKKGEIVREILDNTRTTLSLVEQLSDELTGKTPEKIGIELVQSEVTGELHQFFKGTPSLWERYSQWLEEFQHQEKKIEPCLSFELNASRHYNVNLMLAYLFTNKATRDTISHVISGGWWGFPDEPFINRFGFPELAIKHVLFYDGSARRLIGYADAKLFAKELWLYLKTGEQGRIEDILNRRDPAFEENMKKYFKSYKSSHHVTKAKDAYAAAKEMLKRKINELAVVYNGKVYLVKLSAIVKLVS
jgi:hypothetical protein